MTISVIKKRNYFHKKIIVYHEVFNKLDIIFSSLEYLNYSLFVVVCICMEPRVKCFYIQLYPFHELSEKLLIKYINLFYRIYKCQLIFSCLNSTNHFHVFLILK